MIVFTRYAVSTINGSQIGTVRSLETIAAAITA